ncbi:DUF6228 family protein [Streptomyces sp. NBC_00820]|uniref:DUF6228 family protein n=1 Tax=Streptomyces sp. NBC_00820 TaxID=2975842 RepID=UPI002ED37FA0|nr:DUF6228 family protein [Streptomyces sp. NBC_00820]
MLRGVWQSNDHDLTLKAVFQSGGHVGLTWRNLFQQQQERQLSSSAPDLLVQVLSGRPPRVAGKRRCRWALPGCALWMNWWSVSTIKIVCWGWWSAAGRPSGRVGCTGSP